MLCDRHLVIGIGTAYRGDDAVGLVAARRLKTRCSPDMRVIEHDGEAAGVLDYLGEAETACIIDACIAGAEPGTIIRLDAANASLPRIAFGCSTHAGGLAEAIELARALGRLPRRCVVYGIEARAFGIGAPLTPAVAAAAEKVAEIIQAELGTA